jgi:hypothetical protein
LPELGEIYPIGGAGDRLGLVDTETGESLPAALLPYCGRSLLEGLIWDLQVLLFIIWDLCLYRVFKTDLRYNHTGVTDLPLFYNFFIMSHCPL